VLIESELSDVFRDYPSTDDGAANLTLAIKKRDRVTHRKGIHRATEGIEGLLSGSSRPCSPLGAGKHLVNATSHH
jgi:hypothetical protein